MLSIAKGKGFDGGYLPGALMVWLMSALVLLGLSALLANLLRFGEREIAYVSSGLSFLTAASAGFYAARRKRKGVFAAAVLTATALVILLLTVGFLIRGEQLSPASILSLVSFTYAGCIFGSCVLFHPGTGRRAGPAFRRN